MVKTTHALIDAMALTRSVDLSITRQAMLFIIGAAELGERYAYAPPYVIKNMRHCKGAPLHIFVRLFFKELVETSNSMSEMYAVT